MVLGLVKQVKLIASFPNDGKEIYLFMLLQELQILLHKSLSIYHFQGTPIEN